MKRFFTYLFLIVLLTTVSGADSLLFASDYQIEIDNKSEEKEEAPSEVDDIQIYQTQNQIIGSIEFCTEQGNNIDYEETNTDNHFIISAYHSLFILHEQFLI